MSGIATWIRNLSLFLIFNAFIGIILPSEKYKKYITLCLGLVMVFIVLNPIVTWLKSPEEIPINELFKGLNADIDLNTNTQSDYYERVQQQMIKDSFEAQVMAQLSELLQKEDYNLVYMEIETTSDFSVISKIRAVVTKNNYEKIEEEKKRNFIYIEPVKPNQNITNNNEEISKIKNLIANFYTMSVDNIYIEKSN